MAAIDPRLTEAVIPASVIIGVVEIGQRHGCAVERWFAGTALTVGALFDPDARISFRQAVAVLRRALLELPSGPIGMQVGGRDALLTFGILGLALRSCSTFAEALAVGLELHQASGSLMDADAETYGREVAVRLYERAPEPDLLAFLCEEAFCSILLVAKSVLGTDITPVRLELAYPAPAHVAAYRRFFRCPVRFDAHGNRMFFPAALLDLTITTRDATNRMLAVEACRRLLASSGDRTDIVHAVESLLGQNLRRPLTMAQIADQLHVTERTLRRQLSDAGHRFSDIRDRVRHRRAAFLLGESHLSITAVAHEIGFSDAREFRRAHLRWTGRPPSAERRSRPPAT